MARLDKRKSYPFLAPLERGRRGHAAEQAERALRQAVVALEFAPGEFIDKAAVCRRLGVSRFPVSEALGRLAAEGLVDVLPQRGTRAARIRLAEVIEAMLIRQALETMVARIAALRLPEAERAALRDNLAAQAQAVETDDGRRFHSLDLAFHEILVAGLGLHRVGAAIESSRSNVDRVRRLLSSPRRLAVTLAEHGALVDAIAKRDPDGAGAAMAAHLDAVTEELERFSAENAEVFV